MMDPLKPSTFLSPGQLSELDQWEAEVDAVVSECVEMFRKIEAESGPQSVATWTGLLVTWLDHERLAAITASLMRKAAREPIEAP